MQSAETNLTGIWLGLYSYPRALEPVSFTATLIETGNRLSGSTHEANRFDAGTLYATLLGSRDGRSLFFVKSYDAPKRGYANPIRYDGMVSDDGSEIEGRWIIRNNWSGRFLMVRSGRNAEARARKRFAEV
jgi:hypothetical protein